MNRIFKVITLFIIFSVMISSAAAAAFTDTQPVFSEAASLIMLGIGLISLGCFMRDNFNIGK
ncbi:hypothetical protein DENIS_4100 [Desulfonema ishimotonii]|uniref:Uncharacterized protein n=1 Tax=Desulfonema ishimotonii TaxID=45657 RepID=A0A401G1M4_9BACT|nr:hypothetical protein [Desulfonema ishimotonii]GBC63111.1 hypothetical protein DENIS_4100 [Desulfonema ishimotonii]